ncbi:RluA family pseudouridine synthase [Clostridium sp. D2Q-14]|uniref:RluA family pseudouridine synthase n=1 Tax=Anaeromonas gelatinilytica TaxID=2683194 RepID=UPI00193B2844|nr:RluA family pseudouridine synthase [Anaeromonas gelatinilytica]MBS4536123.1 RluA family pseudouridine synthase [Anaeromonas gelatinilytica]
MDIIELIVDEESEGRVDSFLASELDEVSRSFIQKLIKNKKVTVNNRFVKSKYSINEGDRIVVEVPEPKKLEVKPEDIDIDIVYEDDDVAIVNKPRGMVVHPAPGNYSKTLVNALLYKLNNLSSINGVIRPGIVHRIDKDTTGLLMIAKTNLAHLSLSQQLKEHSITRRYQALVEGNINEDKGTINAPIGRNPKDRKKMCVIRENSKEAVTHFRVLKRYGNYTLIEARLETGRTHQIRVHMKYINHPIVGDPIYGTRDQKFNLEGQLLHAKIIGFNHPRENEYLEFDSNLPEDFIRILNILEKSRQNM